MWFPIIFFRRPPTTYLFSRVEFRGETQFAFTPLGPWVHTGLSRLNHCSLSCWYPTSIHRGKDNSSSLSLTHCSSFMISDRGQYVGKTFPDPYRFCNAFSSDFPNTLFCLYNYLMCYTFRKRGTGPVTPGHMLWLVCIYGLWPKHNPTPAIQIHFHYPEM